MAIFKLLHDLYRFPGFVPLAQVRGLFGDPHAVVITLRRRRKKTRCGVCDQEYYSHYDKRTRRVRDLSCGDKRVYLTFRLRRVQCSRCGGVKNEGLDWLADNPLYTKRFAFFVGRRCRQTPIKEVAEELFLDWHAVKELDKQYMAQLRRVGTPRPGHRHRRNRRRQGAPVPHRRQRPGAWSSHLVWRRGPFRGQPGRVLCLAGPRKMRQNPRGGHGHVAGVP